MKILKLIIAGLIFLIIVNSCKGYRNFRNTDNHRLKVFLVEIINDTTKYYINELKITDKNIYEILDSAIYYSKQCEYFDKQVPYLQAFRIETTKLKGSEIAYKIEGNISKDVALNWSFSKDIGGAPLSKGFYYKNFLFVVNDSNIGDKLESYVFWKETECSITVQPSRLRDNYVYSSYLLFKRNIDHYKIIENKMCGAKVLITK